MKQMTEAQLRKLLSDAYEAGWKEGWRVRSQEVNVNEMNEVKMKRYIDGEMKGV